MEDEVIGYISIGEFCRRERFDIDPCLIEDFRHLPEESDLIMENTLDLEHDSVRLDMTPVSRHTAIWLDAVDILTVELVDRDDSTSDITDDLIGWSGIATLGKLIGNISLFSDDDGDLIDRLSMLFVPFWFLFLSPQFRFSDSEEVLYDVIMDRSEYTSRFP